jgi:hypothetical protein
MPRLTARQNEQVARCLDQLQASSVWHGGLPVLLLERCWLRLTPVPVEQLAQRLPPDSSRDAPELVQFRWLLGQGHSPSTAEQLCWLEFGPEACRQAQRRFWQAQEQGNQGWSLERYLDLLRQYRQRFDQAIGAAGQRQLPLLVLARSGDAPPGSVHDLVWLRAGASDLIRPMRHTCA